MTTCWKCKSKNDDNPIGHVHLLNGLKTLCGKEIPFNGSWYIGDRKPTCPKCIKLNQSK